MRDRIEQIAFVGGIFIGVAMAIAMLATILLQVAPALKYITRYSYATSKHAARLTDDVGSDHAFINKQSGFYFPATSFSRAETARVDPPSLGVSSQTKPRR